MGLTNSTSGIITAVDLEKIESSKPNRPDDYLSRLLKYIPTEIIALYITLRPLLSRVDQTGKVDQTAEVIHWCIFIFGIFITPVYLWRLQNVNKFSQLLVSTLAFGVWIFAIGGPFEQLNWYNNNRPYVALVVPIYTFLIPLFKAD